MSDRKLGKGLDFLIKRTSPTSPSAAETASAATPPRQVRVDDVHPNPHQPRRHFDIEALNDLIESIRLHGVLQPVAVRRTARGYELIAGERRWRACQELGLEEIPATVREATDQEMLEFALVENIQREDLDPIERARAYKRLMERFDLTQEEAARRLSQKRSTVANFVRLLDLPDSIQQDVSTGSISMGHARALLAVSDAALQRQLATRVKEGRLTVRAVEREARETKQTPPSAASRVSPHVAELEGRLRDALGTKVSLRGTGRRGRVVIDYYDPAALERILACIEAGAATGRARSAPLD